MAFWIALTFLALALLLVAIARGSTAGVWIAKPLASTGFVATALAAGAATTGFGRLMLVALVLSWIGDVLLIPRTRTAFTAGLASFLAGHLAFAAAFLVRGVALPWLAVTIVLLVPFVVAFDRWAGPHVPAGLVLPVRAYVVVICTMVACAAGTYGHAAAPLLLAGAIAFFLSDLAVARDRFVAPGFVNRLWGLPLYYGGQILLAISSGA